MIFGPFWVVLVHFGCVFDSFWVCLGHFGVLTCFGGFWWYLVVCCLFLLFVFSWLVCFPLTCRCCVCCGVGVIREMTFWVSWFRFVFFSVGFVLL